MPDNLPELRDIHLPDGVSAFPPAYGWWVILALIIGFLLLYYLVRLARIKSKKLYALHLLENINCNNSLRAAAGMSEILRRICVYKYPEAAVLSGGEWIVFLNNHTKAKLNDKTADLLLNAPYMPEGEGDFSVADVVALRLFCQKWIGENL